MAWSENDSFIRTNAQVSRMSLGLSYLLPWNFKSQLQLFTDWVYPIFVNDYNQRFAAVSDGVTEFHFGGFFSSPLRNYRLGGAYLLRQTLADLIWVRGEAQWGWFYAGVQGRWSILADDGPQVDRIFWFCEANGCSRHYASIDPNRLDAVLGIRGRSYYLELEQGVWGQRIANHTSLFWGLRWTWPLSKDLKLTPRAKPQVPTFEEKFEVDEPIPVKEPMVIDPYKPSSSPPSNEPRTTPRQQEREREIWDDVEIKRKKKKKNSR